MQQEYTNRQRILYVGPIGWNWIHECIPGDMHVSFLELKHILHHLLSFRVLYFLCLNICRDFIYVIQHPKSLIRFSILDAQDQDLILSCSDNWPWLQSYASRRDSPVVLVQNATRKCKDREGHFSNTIPIYCAWGDLEEQIFQSCGITIKDFHPVGSVKLGIAYERFQNIPETKDHDLVFISQFRPTAGFLDRDADSNALDSQINSCQRRSFELLRDFAERNDRQITILSKTRGPEDYPLEINYFTELANGLDFNYIEGDKDERDFSTYFSCFSSKLIITLNSSLGFELLAAGKKVLFCGAGIQNFIDHFDVRPYFDSLPREVKLETATSENFRRKVRGLEALSDADVQQLIAEPAKLIVNFSATHLTHYRVRQIIVDSLSSPAASTTTTISS